jgi:hypothetical protein
VLVASHHAASLFLQDKGDAALNDLRQELSSRHAQALLDIRSAAEASQANALALLKASAEIRHTEAMTVAANAYGERDESWSQACAGLRRDVAQQRSSALQHKELWEQEKITLCSQVDVLQAAASTASFGPLGGAPGVPHDVQTQIDAAINEITQNRALVRTREDQIRLAEVALRNTSSECSAHVLYRNQFSAFVKNREGEFKTEIQQLKQELFMVECGQNQADHAALQNAHREVNRLSSDVSTLKAELRSSTLEGTELRRTPWSAPGASPTGAPQSFVPNDIRHSTLHETATYGMTNTAEGLRGVVESVEARFPGWYDSGPNGVITDNRRSAQHNPTHYSIGEGTGPDVRPLLSLRGGPPPVFNSFQDGPGSRAPLPTEDPARAGLAGIVNLSSFRAPGP